MSYNSELQTNNINLQALLDAVNALPEASSGIELPTLDSTVKGTANDLAFGKKLYDDDGNLIEGTIEILNEPAELDVDNGAWNNTKGALRAGFCSTEGRIILEPNVMVYLDIVGSTLGDAAPEDVVSGKTFTSSSGLKVTGTYEAIEEPVLQSKTVSPSTSSQTVKPDSGYDGLSQVTVNAMATATQATPSITVSSSGLITASATQTTGYVSAGTKSATKQLTTQAAQTITPTTSNKTISSGRYLTGTQTIKGDANLVAGNIKKDVSIFGVTGTYEGDSSSGGLPIGHVTHLASGKYIPSQNSISRVDVNHNLGVTPNFLVLILENSTSNNALTSALTGAAVFYKDTKYNSSSSIMYRTHILMEGYNSGTSGGAASRADSTAYFTSTTFGIPCNSTYPLVAGFTYRWVCGVLDGIL